jgi:Uma2 family endonuclease
MTPAAIAPPIGPSPFSGNGTATHSAPVAVANHCWTPHRWTIAEYRKLAETGLFTDVKTMLIQGEIFTMPLPDPPHDTALNLTQEYLRAAFPKGHYVRNQQGFDIGLDTDPGPDLAVVIGSIRDYTTRTPTTAVLIVEISDTTLFKDLTTKAEQYATAKVPEYWVVDLVNRQLHVFRDPVELPKGLGATAYRKHTVHAEADTVAPQAAPSASIRVSELLP